MAKSEDISNLYRTLGSYMWLDHLTDEEMLTIERDIISVYRKAMASRKVVPSGLVRTDERTTNEPPTIP